MRRSTALTAAATIALGGVALATPAFAEEADGPVLDTKGFTPAPTEETKQAAEQAGVVAYGTNAAGEEIVVVTVDSEIADDENAIDAFAAKAFGSEVDAATVVLPSAPRAFAEGDVVGGQGYAGLGNDDYLYACSIGFSAFAPNGDPAFIGAGHCAYDQNDEKIEPTLLTIPSQEPAVGGEGYGFEEAPILLGTFGFAQFGGPDGTAGAEGDVNSTDISVVDINSAGGWNMIPAVTDWTTAGDTVHSLADSAVPVKAVGAPSAGEVSKAGRTTGFTTGAIDSDDLLDGWANIEGRWVRGFSSNTLAAPGDSGGSVIQDNTAVGVISGGIEGTATRDQWTWATSLVHGLEFLGGYEVALDLDAPVVASPADGATVEPGTTVTVNAPGAETLEIAVAGGGGGGGVTVTDGVATFPAPETEGTYEYTLTSVNGHSRSESTTYSITVENAPIAAPAITSPEGGAELNTPVSEISGTGVAGATVTVTVNGAEVGTATVAADGTWTVDGLDLGFGDFTVAAVQELDGETSNEATVSFSVVLEAPAITSPEDGAEYTSPITTVNGTGIPGATVTVTVDGVEVGTAAAASAEGFAATVGDDGVWAVEGIDLGYGEFTVVAVQEFDGETSAEASASFSVAPAAPTITNPANGENFELADFPIIFEGTGTPGAVISLELSDVGTVEVEVDADGNWTATSPGQDLLQEGEYTLTATQTIDEVTSAASSVVFSVVTETGGDDAADGTDGADGETDGTDGGGDDQLPATGADSFITLTAAAGGVILLAGGITLLTLRRRAALIQE